MLTFLFGTQLQEGLGISFREGLHRPPSLCAARNAYCFFSSLLYSIELIIAQKIAVVKRFKMTYKNKVASLHSVWRSDKARTAEGLHIMADNIINVRDRHFRREDIAHRVEVAEQEETLAELRIIYGRVGAKVDKIRVVKDLAKRGKSVAMKIVVFSALVGFRGAARHRDEEEAGIGAYFFI